MKYIYFFLTVLFISVSFQTKADVEGSADHPVVSRYEGSEITDYDKREFDEYKLFVGKVTGKRDNPNNKVTNLEGTITKITYYLPDDRSTLEIFKNYESELTNAGFEVLYTCSNKDCGGRDFNHAVHEYNTQFGDNYYDQRYLAGKLTRDTGDIYVSLYLIKNTGGGGPDRNHIYTQLDVIEVAPMQQGMVTVDADAMAKEIFKTGSISIYGILFDFDKATIKPESSATIAEIAKLLNDNPDLKLYVVGHTDNQGSLDYNTSLSGQRAASVVNELSTKHGVDKTRLTPKGLAFLAPVDTNRNEEGRAKNRRVELVEK
ncbi:MAG: OmpA family protein [Thermodesulfobacteriota bacterium]